MNSILEFDRHPSYVYVLIQDSEADSEEGEQETTSVLSGKSVENASAMGPDVRHSTWPFLMTVPLDDAVRHASVRLLSTWDAGAEDKDDVVTGVHYGFVPKAKRCSDVHLLLNDTTDVEAYLEIGSLGVVRQYEQSGSNIADDQSFGWATGLTAHSVYRDLSRLVQTHWSVLGGGPRGRGISVDVGGISPAKMADFIVHTHEYNERWLGTFADQLHRRLPSVSLTKILRVWNLRNQEAADGFGVSSEMLEEWIKDGVPSHGVKRLSDLSAATDVLLHYLKPDRIPAVVRKPIGRLDGKSPHGFVFRRRIGANTARVSAVCFGLRMCMGRDFEYRRLSDKCTWWRVADPIWKDPLNPMYSKKTGGRWNPPNGFPTLYLNGDRQTARCNVGSFIGDGPYEPEDLRDEAAPILIGCELPRNQVVGDAVTNSGVRAAGLPDTYPLDAEGSVVKREVCQDIGTQIKAEGKRGVHARCAKSSNRGDLELAWFPASSRSGAREVSETSVFHVVLGSLIQSVHPAARSALECGRLSSAIRSEHIW